MNKVAGQVIEIGFQKYSVRSGPHLWVSKLLHERGCLSSNKIWEEYKKDETVAKDLISSKKFLKERILHQMYMQGKIVPGRALDIPRFSKSGWELVPEKAFKSVDAGVLTQMTPLPAIKRKDYVEFLKNNNIPHEF